jgi:riboflavin transporter FmnP
MVYVVDTPAVGLVGVAMTLINEAAEVTGMNAMTNAESVDMISMAVARLDIILILFPFIFLLPYYLLYTPLHISNIIRFREVK